MPKIVLIEPRAPNLHIFSMASLPRLGLLLLGTIARERGWDVEIFFEERRALDMDVLAAADIVGVSTITATAPRAYAIADRVRTLGRPVIMGGPHVTFLADEAMTHADFVLRGEAEESLPLFLETWQAGGDLTAVAGLSFRRGSDVVHNPPAPLIRDLDTLPYPDFGLLDGHRMPKHRTRVIPVQTSRGCPFDCSFCSVTGMFGRRYRFRSTDHIIRELHRYNDKHNVIFFYDDNFAADRARTRELLKAMIAQRFRFRWTTQVRADAARDPELIHLMRRAGCMTVFIGFESVNPQSLEAMHKAQSVEGIRAAVRVFRRNRIKIHGMFVFGFDQDDAVSVRRTVRWAKHVGLMSTQFLILTPLPGSDFYEKVVRERRIRFTDWSLFDGHHAVHEPARLTLLSLQKAQIWGHRHFYSWTSQVRRLIHGRWMALGIGYYARGLNRAWRKRNKTFMKALALMRPRREARVTVDYRQTVSLDGGMGPRA